MGWAWNTVSCHRGRSRLAACVPLPFAAWMLMVGCVGCETKAEASQRHEVGQEVFARSDRILRGCGGEGRRNERSWPSRMSRAEGERSFLRGRQM